MKKKLWMSFLMMITWMLFPILRMRMRSLSTSIDDTKDTAVEHITAMKEQFGHDICRHYFGIVYRSWSELQHLKKKKKRCSSYKSRFKSWETDFYDSTCKASTLIWHWPGHILLKSASKSTTKQEYCSPQIMLGKYCSYIYVFVAHS